MTEPEAMAQAARDTAPSQLLADIAWWRKCTSLPIRLREFGSLAARDDFHGDLWARFDAALAGDDAMTQPFNPEEWRNVSTTTHRPRQRAAMLANAGVPA